MTQRGERVRAAIPAIRGRGQDIARAIGPWARDLAIVVRPLTRRVMALLRPISGLGWGVLAVAVGCWWLGWQFGWVEFSLLATAALALFALCSLLTIGRTYLQVDVRVDPTRVVVGSAAAGQVTVRNLARRPLLPISLELPVADGAARFMLPVLRPRADHEELFVVPTQRRGVVTVGPAMTVRGDPLGLLRRSVAWTGTTELFVHPRTVPLEPIGTGLLRDLEGRTSTNLSMSDLAFHTLREYQPGDDRRYIHWRSSAKAGEFLVKQFLDTRRSHITTIVDSVASSYVEPDDFEMAVSAAASLAVRTIIDGQDITVVAGEQSLPSGLGTRVLDTVARVEFGPRDIDDLVARAIRIAPDTSIAVLVTGSLLPYSELRRAASRFPTEVRPVVLRIDPAAPTGISGPSTLPVLTVRDLSELSALLQGGLP